MSKVAKERVRILLARPDHLGDVLLSLPAAGVLRKALPEKGGEITLTTGYRPGVKFGAGVAGERVSLPLEVTVRDNGSGVPADLLPYIFDPFVTSKPVGKGLGLGLSISYGIVQDFRGRIHAANLAQGGAELVIELPRLMPETVLAEKAAHA